MPPLPYDRDNPNSPDWKFLAQQLARLHMKAHGKLDADRKRTADCGNPECMAAVEAIKRASTHGMEGKRD
jgi:hypothetical protein